MDEYKRRRRRSRAVMSMFLDSLGGIIDDVDVAEFDSDGGYLKALVVGIEPVQSGTGDPSPDNIRPISGHSSVNVIVSPTLNPLDGTITNIPLGTTVYGGTLDVLTGVLTVSHKYKKPPKADIRRNQDTQFYVVVDSEIATGTEVPCISNKFRPWDGTESLYKKEYYCFVNSGGAIRFNTTAEYSTVDDMYNAIGEMEFICQLATPITIQLTGQQIATFLGTNHVWCDSGKIIHLEY